MSQRLQQKAGQLTNTLEEAEIVCPLCQEDFKEEIIKLSACKHILCRNCARTQVLASIRIGRIPILCPFCVTGPEKCQKCMHVKKIMNPQVPEPSARAISARRKLNSWSCFLFGGRPSAPATVSVQTRARGVEHWCCSMDADVPQLLSTTEFMDYTRRSLQVAVNKGGDLLPCPQTDCPGIAVRGNKDNCAGCNACGHCWCVGCGGPRHEHKTCAQHLQEVRQRDVTAEKHFTSYKAVKMVKRCYGCGHGLEKIAGCDHVTCASVTHNFSIHRKIPLAWEGC